MGIVAAWENRRVEVPLVIDSAEIFDGRATRECRDPSRPGVAVQINAFNFPVWGSLEKFAPAFLAGMPTLVKPATPTGYLAEAFVRILVESGLLPESFTIHGFLYHVETGRLEAVAP